MKRIKRNPQDLVFVNPFNLQNKKRNETNENYIRSTTYERNIKRTTFLPRDNKLFVLLGPLKGKMFRTPEIRVEKSFFYTKDRRKKNDEGKGKGTE